MTEQHDDLSFMDQVEADPRGRAEMAVADAQLQLEALFEQAVEEAGEVNERSIADALGVPVERVQRILTGEDPLRFESFIRYLSTLGRTAKISLTTHESSHERIVDHFEQLGASPNGITTITWHRETPDYEAEAIEAPRHTGSTWTTEKGVEIELVPAYSLGKSYQLSASGKIWRFNAHSSKAAANAR